MSFLTPKFLESSIIIKNQNRMREIFFTNTYIVFSQDILKIEKLKITKTIFTKGKYS